MGGRARGGSGGNGEISYVWLLERKRREGGGENERKLSSKTHLNRTFLCAPSHSLCILILVKYCAILRGPLSLALTSHSHTISPRLLLIPPPTHAKNNKHLLSPNYNTFE